MIPCAATCPWPSIVSWEANPWAEKSFDRAQTPPHHVQVRFSIVTPSYRSSDWLRLCVASVADQSAEAEHIVQDAGSDDGTLDWLARDSRVKLRVERDRGMYDAINRGFRGAAGDIFAWLNCDEQYLPGTLARVALFFAQNPQVDVAFGDVVVADKNGCYLSHRRMQTPLKYHTWTCQLSTLSCGTFFRSRLFRERGFEFDPELRDVGDGKWMLGLLSNRIPMATLGGFTSVFTRTGANMSAGDNARRENRGLCRSAPFWARCLRPLIILHHRARRFVGGMYRQAPFTYEIYTLNSPEHRLQFRADHPRFQEWR